MGDSSEYVENEFSDGKDMVISSAISECDLSVGASSSTVSRQDGQGSNHLASALHEPDGKPTFTTDKNGSSTFRNAYSGSGTRAHFRFRGRNKAWSSNQRHTPHSMVSQGCLGSLHLQRSPNEFPSEASRINQAQIPHLQAGEQPKASFGSRGTHSGLARNNFPCVRGGRVPAVVRPIQQQHHTPGLSKQQLNKMRLPLKDFSNAEKVGIFQLTSLLLIIAVAVTILL